MLDYRRPVGARCPSKPTERGCCATVSVPACWCRCRQNARWSAAGTQHFPRSGTKSIINRNTANHWHSVSNRFASAITTADYIHTSIIDVSSAIASTTSTRHWIILPDTDSTWTWYDLTYDWYQLNWWDGWQGEEGSTYITTYNTYDFFLNIFWGYFGDILGIFKGIGWIFSGYFLGIFWIFSGYFLGIFWIIFGYFLDRFFGYLKSLGKGGGFYLAKEQLPSARTWWRGRHRVGDPGLGPVPGQ